jgi:suppressor for copper-sensitivity B
MTRECDDKPPANTYISSNMSSLPGNIGRRTVRLLAAAVAFATLAATPARAEPHASDWAGDNKETQVRLVSAVAGTGELEELRLGLQFRMDPGWKVYWRSAGTTGYPPTVDWSRSAGIGDVEFLWPAPVRFKIFGIEAVGYKEEVVFPVNAPLARPGEAADLSAEVDYLTCKEICIPGKVLLALDIPAGPADATPFAALIDRYRARVPVSAEKIGMSIEQAVFKPVEDAVSLRVAIKSDRPLVDLDLFAEGPPLTFFENPQVRLSKDGRYAVITLLGIGAEPDEIAASPMLGTLVTPDLAVEQPTTPVLVDSFPPLPPEFENALSPSGGSLWSILGFALLGGLILNLMPCVLPVLSLKLLSVLGHGGRENTDVRLGFLASVAGIVTSFMILAAVLAAVKSAGASIGWGIQFQQPVFLAVMVVVVTLFAANLFGLFEIILPSRLNDMMALDTGSKHEHHHSLGGHFLTGVFATLLATPCSAPFLGTAVGFAFARGTAEIFMVFAALGLGLSLPYLVVAAFPGLATRLPRPGKWMVGMKRFLGFLLAGTGLWLVTVIATEAGTQTAAGIAIAAVLIGVVLAVRRVEGSRLGRHGGKVAALLAAVIVAAPLFAPAGANDGARALDDSIWRPFDQAEIHRLVAGGKTVLVDVTADWCLTCQVNKAAVLNRDPVAGILESGDVVAMKADWTRPSQEIADYLASFGRYGIPFDAVYGPHAPGGVVLPEFLVTDTVLAAFEEATGAGGIAAK